MILFILIMADESNEPAVDPPPDNKTEPVDNSAPPNRSPAEAVSKVDRTPAVEVEKDKTLDQDTDKPVSQSEVDKNALPNEKEKQDTAQSQDEAKAGEAEGVEAIPSETSEVAPVRASKWHRLATKTRGQYFVPPSTGRKLMAVPDCWPQPELPTWRLLEYRDKLHLPPWYNWKLTAGMACTGFTPTNGQWDGKTLTSLLCFSAGRLTNNI